MHFAIGYPCVSDFLLSFCYPGSVGQVCLGFGQVICNIDYRQWILTLMLLISDVRSNIVGLRLLTWLPLLMWWGPFRAESAACLHHSCFGPSANEFHKQGPWRRRLLTFFRRLDSAHPMSDGYLVQFKRWLHLHRRVAESQNFFINWAGTRFWKTENPHRVFPALLIELICGDLQLSNLASEQLDFDVLLSWFFFLICW